MSPYVYQASSECSTGPAISMIHYVHALIAPLSIETFMMIVILKAIALAIMVFGILLYLWISQYGDNNDEFVEDEEEEESMVFMRGSKM
jgi:hypothetical protein